MPVRTESQVTGYVHHTQWSQRLAPIRFGRRLRKRIWRQGLLGAVLEAGYHNMYIVKKARAAFKVLWCLGRVCAN